MTWGDTAVTLRRVRSDALPENIDYLDAGCEAAPSCLTCPFPRCRYDEPGGLPGARNRLRMQDILALRVDKLPVWMVANMVGVSRRTVFRVQAQAKGVS